MHSTCSSEFLCIIGKIMLKNDIRQKMVKVTWDNKFLTYS